MNDILKEEVIEVISTLNKIPKEKIDPEISFRDTGLDSFALVEIVFAVENKYDITFPQESLMDIVTLNEFLELVRKLIKEKETAA